MNKQITALESALALHENVMGPPTEADATDTGVQGLKAVKKKKFVTTGALTADTCRWPFGDPAEADFHYCGKQPLVGRPYCDKHDAQSYQAARKRTA
jgi:hypothetical protein